MVSGTQTPIPMPVFASYFADPFVFCHEGTYYAIGTGATNDDSGRVLRMLRSADLVTWESLGGALEPLEGKGGDYWAPEIAYRDGKFVMVYSVGFGDRGQHLRTAVSEKPEGPYVDCGDALIQEAVPSFTIDGGPFQDEDGRWYLFYARDFLDSDRPGTSLVVAPWDDPHQLSPEFKVVCRAKHDWQLFQARRPMYGGVLDWYTLEGPAVVLHEGRYYCFYSGGNWQNGTYGVDYVVANTVMGPYEDTNKTGAPRVLKTTEGALVGPGHNSLFRDANGDLRIAFHAWRDGERRFYVGKINWTPEGPTCVF